MEIKVNTRVTKKGDSLDSPTIGTVLRVSGNRAEVDWGYIKGWDTLHSLRVVADDEPSR